MFLRIKRYLAAKKVNLREIPKRILSLDDPPEKLAASFAVGLGISFGPTYGIHTPLSILFSMVFRLNIMVTILASGLNAPLTPLVYIAGYFIGVAITPYHYIDLNIDWNNLKEIIGIFFSDKTLIPFLIGTTIEGIFFGLVSYFTVLRWLRRRRKLKRQTAESLQ